MVIDEREEAVPLGDVFKRNIRTTYDEVGHDKVRVVEMTPGLTDTYPEQAEVAMQLRRKQRLFYASTAGGWARLRQLKTFVP